MNNDEVFQIIQEAMRTAFDMPDLNVAPDTLPANVPGWDSIANVNLALELQKRFGVEIDPIALESIGCVGDLIDVIRNS
jgi:acyl carrier protein